jgi:hypothetical protein
MKKISLMLSFAVIMLCIASAAYADLDSFLMSVNVQANSDMNNFSVRLSAQFGVPVPRVNAVIKSVEAPADAFMVLQLGQMANKQPEAVLRTYKRSRGKGWGVMAKELGIKPGSPAFHALKRGDFSFTGASSAGQTSEGRGNGNGKGKGKGHNK